MKNVTPTLFGLNIFISNQFIQYNTIFNHTNIRIRMEARAYQVLLLNFTLFGVTIFVIKCQYMWPSNSLLRKYN